ncbi:GH1 family beta-glucosidase [Cerasicoccus arenae]|uniref:Beta-glucosidase n=1 Tax=Cerasicoccus arenae TaxID=424488 RepID=A0A8J3D8W4_9BACT|nr:GH1 family beta-glucosidase [Cerasicoccus arenae]MBK1858126.1 beta-glucosidase [Cerasicoccus arenae]GHB96647.1 hypothetical protein GCM10007047_10690 [Cerasicoccus arenae]
MNTPNKAFPENFAWGVSTSSYQIEGSWDADGKGPSIWDKFTDQSGKAWRNQHGRIACDHYNRYRDDVALMSQMGINAYRFSVSWPRIIPEGEGTVNQAGLDFYDSLVDTLLEHQIEPWVTLFHWDFPYALFLRGGWLNPNIPTWFAKYTSAVVDRLSDRVQHWITINEPQCFLELGHHTGEHAPGLRLDLREILLAGHNVLLSHGRAVSVIREKSKRKPNIGWAPAGPVFCPATNKLDDIKAAEKAAKSIFPDTIWNNSWWVDPVVFGSYPEDGLRIYGKAAPKVPDSDFDIIKQPIDFFGCNIFQGVPVTMSSEGTPVAAEQAPGQPLSLYEWHQAPESLYWGPRIIHEHYKLPIVITENGLSSGDQVNRDGSVHDNNRIDFLIGYLISLKKALDDGVDIRGYFHWSFMDNFEWQEGYKHRFGLVYVDYQNQNRKLKDSAFWYKELIASNGSSLNKYQNNTEAPMPYVIKETLRYIEENVGENFNIKTIAAHLNCHPDFLSRTFKQHTEGNLSEYIRRIRIDLAMEILRRPGSYISDATGQSGFSDPVHFAKVFRKLVGMTPGQYKKQYQALPENQIELQSISPLHPRSRTTQASLEDSNLRSVR